MDTKWKSRYIPIGMFIIISFLLGYVLLAGYDIFTHRNYIRSYYNTKEFEKDITNLSLRSYFRNVLGIVTYETDIKKHPDNIDEGEIIRYEQYKKWVDHYDNLKYYVINPETEDSFTNIKDITDMEGLFNYIRNESIYSIEFPLSHKDYILQEVDKQFLNQGLKGWLIIPKEVSEFSKLHANKRYYDSIQERLIKEGYLGIAAIGICVILILYLRRKTQEKSIIGKKATAAYTKIPLDIRGFLFVICTLFIFFFLGSVSFFYFPVGINHMMVWTCATIYAFFLLVNIQSVIPLIKDKKELNKQWEKSYWYKMRMALRESLMIKRVFLEVISIFLLTLLFVGLSFFVFDALYWGEIGINTFIYGIYVVLYVLVIPRYIMEKVGYFNKIVKATENMANGNLSQILEVRGRDYVARLAANINNIQNGMMAALENQMKSERLKTELIANVSHDLKTPLTSIINYIDLLKKENRSREEMEGYIEVLDRKATRLKNLIEDLFEASKMASGAVKLNIEKVDIVALLKQTMAEYDDKISQSSLIFKLDLPNHPIYLSLDGKKTWRIFENLISNILKYSHPDTRVYIDIQKEDMVRISMKNISGYEMNFDAEELFERFKRGDASRHTEGSGLGLAIAKSIIELENGTLGIEIDGDLFKVIIEFPLDQERTE